MQKEDLASTLVSDGFRSNLLKALGLLGFLRFCGCACLPFRGSILVTARHGKAKIRLSFPHGGNPPVRRALCLRWHPDKSEGGDKDLSTRVFQQLSELKPWFLPEA